MGKERRREQAETFHALHHRGEILVLPNAWDAASAKVFENAGFPAIGTTSGGVAWSLGFPDGERIGRNLLLETVARIVGAVRVPVTVDLERGYGATPAEVCDTVRGIIEAGGVGINIEDGVGATPDTLASPDVLVEKIRAIRDLCAGIDAPLFINARTDVYLHGGIEAAARFEEARRRLQAYAGAGADGVFAPGIYRLDEIARLVREVPLPLNVYAADGVPPAKELDGVGVARVSVGCGPMQATLGLTRRIAAELLATGTWSSFTDGALSYGEANGLFAGTSGRT